MAIQIRPANRSQSKLRLGISGPAGSGKTYSAILLASGIAPLEKVVFLDTENGSASMYSDLGKYNVATMSPPYSPEAFISAIKECEDAGMEVIVIDSASMEWSGPGGVLDIHGKLLGNSFTNWAKVTPRHDAFIQAILQSKCHIIACTRRKSDYSVDKDSQGKTTITKVGLAAVQRDSFEFELTTEFILDQVHMTTVGKDRTGIWMDKPSFQITKGTGKVLLDWCNSGAKPDLPGVPDIIKEDVRQAIK